jgi:hypothetical protein
MKLEVFVNPNVLSADPDLFDLETGDADIEKVTSRNEITVVVHFLVPVIVHTWFDVLSLISKFNSCGRMGFPPLLLLFGHALSPELCVKLSERTVDPNLIGFPFC